MQLLALSPAEMAFLAAPASVADCLQTRLTRKLVATLTARLRLPVQATVIGQTQSDTTTGEAPLWQPDAGLATLWLTRRLGGQRVTGTASFVPQSLSRTLDAALAECWLDNPVPAMPSSVTWQVATRLAQANLSLQLPPNPTDMTRWARGVIRHA
jgi:hypothetical protein